MPSARLADADLHPPEPVAVAAAQKIVPPSSPTSVPSAAAMSVVAIATWSRSMACRTRPGEAAGASALGRGYHLGPGSWPARARHA